MLCRHDSTPCTIRPLERLPLLRLLQLTVSNPSHAAFTTDLWQFTQLQQVELRLFKLHGCLHVPEHIVQLVGLERLGVERGTLGPLSASATGKADATCGLALGVVSLACDTTHIDKFVDISGLCSLIGRCLRVQA